MLRRTILLFAMLLFAQATSLAGNIYDITSTDGTKTVTYQVRFGGGKLFESYTAFDPASKKFVYLEWKRN